MNNKQLWDNFYHKHKNIKKYPSEYFVRFVGRCFKDTDFKSRKNIKTLELGCAFGNNLYFIKNEGFDTYGCDISSDAISFLQKDFKDKVWCGDIFETSIDEKYDFIYGIGILECSTKEKITCLLKNIYNSLNGGGICYFLITSKGSNILQDNDFVKTPVDEKMVFDLFREFSKFEIDTVSYTLDSGSKKFEFLEVKCWK